MDLLRRFVTEPPDQQTFRQNKPTLLVSWWCTAYSVTIIFFRVAGRYIRTEKIFVEDGLMLLAILPLLMRMAFAHVVLLYGTNNTVITGLTDVAIHRREIGSQLVLASRIMYAAYLWTVKYSVSMFLRTLTESVWRSSYQKYLRYLHIFLAVTFVGTIVGDLAACQPFSNYWQVVPDPGPQCRQGYAQLFTMGILNVITNFALILFPIPMILKSRLPRAQKTGIIIRLGLPLIGVAITLYQIPSVISRRGEQQYRSLIASVDILLATFTANAVVLGSLLSDRGYKKTKYKHGAAAQGFNTKTKTTGGTRIVRNQWGSDEDLMRTSDVDSKAVVISLDTFDPPTVPPKSKFQEIRVNSSWEVHVDEISSTTAKD